MYDHNADEKAVKECDDLLKEHENLVQKFKTMMDKQKKQKNA